MAINYNKHVWEGWTVQDFIDELHYTIKMIMSGNSIFKKFTTKAELKKWLKENQPYYKKDIPEVLKHFSELYELH